MNGFNRLLLVIMSLAWIGLLAGGLLLVWDNDRSLSIDREAIDFSLNLTLTEAEKILVTIVMGALMAPAVGLLALELGSGLRRGHRMAKDGDRADTARIEAERRASERYGSIETRLERIESLVTGSRDEPAVHRTAAPVSPDTHLDHGRRNWFNRRTPVNS